MSLSQHCVNAYTHAFHYFHLRRRYFVSRKRSVRAFHNMADCLLFIATTTVSRDPSHQLTDCISRSLPRRLSIIHFINIRPSDHGYSRPCSGKEATRNEKLSSLTLLKIASTGQNHQLNEAKGLEAETITSFRSSRAQSQLPLPIHILR